LEDGLLFCLLRELPFKAGIFSSEFTLTFSGRHLLLPLAPPGVELGLVQAELASSSSDTSAFSKFKGFLAELWGLLFAGLIAGCG
jgi:hypothetical protein